MSRATIFTLPRRPGRPVGMLASLASALALACVSCASDEVDKRRPLGDEEQAQIEKRAEQDQEHLDENIDQERRR